MTLSHTGRDEHRATANPRQPCTVTNMRGERGGVQHARDSNGMPGPSGINSAEMASLAPSETARVGGFVQEPVAVVSMACRLPDDCNSPGAFWKFLERGGVARNTPPDTRFALSTHYDGSLRRQTMASPGGMLLQHVDPRDVDAQFFRLSPIEAASMDPQQRQLLEVVYEGLENGGITMEELDGADVGCFVGSFACDYGDIQARDPENRAPAAQIGIGRAMLSNRISHFFNLKGTRYVTVRRSLDPRRVYGWLTKVHLAVSPSTLLVLGRSHVWISHAAISKLARYRPP